MDKTKFYIWYQNNINKSLFIAKKKKFSEVKAGSGICHELPSIQSIWMLIKLFILYHNETNHEAHYSKH